MQSRIRINILGEVFNAWNDVVRICAALDCSSGNYGLWRTIISNADSSTVTKIPLVIRCESRDVVHTWEQVVNGKAVFFA